MRAILATVLAGSVGFALCAQAETALPFATFEAKRIGVPVPGQKRNLVQIDPEAQKAALAVMPKPAATVPQDIAAVLPGAIGHYGWFWERVSPSIFDTGPGRLEEVMTVIAGSKTLSAPRLQQLQTIASHNGRDILSATIGTAVSPALVLAVIAVESSGVADAVSSAGAQGLMQLMPDTAARFDVRDSFSPTDNIRGGVAYLNWLMAEFGGDPVLVLAGYNAGEGNLRNHAGVPPFAETRDYVPKVLAAFQVARGLCLTPPELISDGCVFAGMK